MLSNERGRNRGGVGRCVGQLVTREQQFLLRQKTVSP